MIKLYGGDCLDVTPKFPVNHFDSLITDCPYGLKFMGKDWDRGIPGVRFWKEFLRVCKPGAFALVFGGTRTYHRLTCAIEDAGWQIRDCMMWLYGSGFPKGHDIPRQYQIKKHGWRGRCISNFIMGREYIEERRFWWRLEKKWNGYNVSFKPAWEPIIVAMKPLDGTFAQNAEKYGVAGLWIDGGRIGTADNIPSRSTGLCDASKTFGQVSKAVTTEPWVAKKGRWPANLILDEESAAMLDEQSGISGSRKTTKRITPANRAETYSGFENCSGEVNAPNTYEGYGGASRFFKILEPEPCFFCGYVEEHGNLEVGSGVYLCDECLLEGSALDLPNRFLYCAKASRSERNAGLEGMEIKDSMKSEKMAGIAGTYPDGKPRPKQYQQNNHPTVKPLKLMEYLCRLTRTPEGGPVLDPFGGSGTTALACMNTGRDCVIVEKEPAYCEIIRGRVKANAAKKN